MKIEIDNNSGFCFGVIRAIQNVEKELNIRNHLYSLGDIVHNRSELKRLEKKGLKIITHDLLLSLYGEKILFRTHGEPPSTYEIANKNNIQIIDTTCPVVLKLQKKIKKIYQVFANKAKIIIIGKLGHAEVNSLVGQTEGTATVIANYNDLLRLNLNQNIYLFSQTTGSLKNFQQIIRFIQNRLPSHFSLFAFNTICKQITNRIKHIKIFAKKNDLILFVSGEKSSNGKILLNESKKSNSNTYSIIDETEIPFSRLNSTQSVGICGGTSTPRWVMEKVALALSKTYT